MPDPLLRLCRPAYRQGRFRPELDGEHRACSDCGAIYGVKDGAAVLAANAQSNLAKFEEKPAHNPSWYAEIQPPELISPCHQRNLP